MILFHTNPYNVWLQNTPTPVRDFFTVDSSHKMSRLRDATPLGTFSQSIVATK